MFVRHITSVFPLTRFYSGSPSFILRIGDILKKTRTFSNTDVLEYSKLSCDHNPIHLNAECAQKAGFENPIVHGMLVASVFPQIIASSFPGAVYVSQTLKFILPVCIGENISAQVQSINIKESKKKFIVKFSTKCFKNGDFLAVDGEAVAMLPTLLIKAEQIVD